MEQKEEKKDMLNLEEEFKLTMKTMMEYLAATNPSKIEELGKTYKLLENYQTDPENYLKKDIPIDYYIETQNTENWFQKHIKNIESLREKVKESINEGIEKISQVFK